MSTIGFDAQATQGTRSGLGVFTSRLLEFLRPEVQEPLKLNVYFKRLEEGQRFNTLDRLRWENWSLPRLAKRDRIDLLHVPAFAPPLRKPCRLVVTVHDIAGKLFPNQMGRLSAFYWGNWLPFTIQKADCLMVDSYHTKDDLVRHLKISEKKIRVVYPSGHENFSAAISGTAIAEVQRRFGIVGDYFLFVGTLEPRKNLARILEAFKRLRAEYAGLQMVIVGSKEFAHGKYAEILVEKYGLDSGAVRAPGFLSHSDLNALYCGALALLFPSLYEGFGIPILEAMASGCPVLTSTTTSTPEVAGEAGLLVDPYSVDEILTGMKNLAGSGSLREDLKQKGFNQIKKFSWKKTAQETLNTYKGLI